MSCWWCGAGLGDGDRFCAACGQSRRAGGPWERAADAGLWPAEGENRMLTVLFPDLSGYMAASRQAPGDEAVRLVDAVLGTYIDAIEQRAGFVARCMHDEVLALFGVPLAGADDPVRAVETALAIRDAIHALGLDVKIAINTGLLYFGPVGNARHAELAVVGPAADVAARLVGKGDRVAEAGQILVGESTFEQTRHCFDFAPPRVHALKGIRAPVSSHELLGARPAAGEPVGHPDAAWSRIAAEIDRLGRTDRQLLQIAGAIERPLSPDLLARLAPAADAGRLDALAAAGWLIREGGTFTVADPAVREVLDRSLLPARRAALRAAV
ncbi:MAG TPA: adenylate/guanylate cyclase domain-containing protein [Kofleriaceae bacterium]|nr:adenylate/guanylate cyclase domain-containing protein [Kofleriaceae bacterium]